MVALERDPERWESGGLPGIPVAQRGCRAYWFAGRVHQVLDEVLAGGVRVGDMLDSETAEAVVELSRAQARIEALKLQLLAHGEHVDVAAAARPPATSTGAWLASATRTPTGTAHRQVRLAKRLDTAYTATRDAGLAGDIDPSQTQVIVEALDRLPGWVDAEQRRRAEEHLIGLAAERDAKALRLLARHLAHVLNPEAADAELADRLAKEEADAARQTMFSMVDDGQGTCHGKFKIPALQGAMLATALNALASPRRPDPIDREMPDPEDPDQTVVRPTAEILGEAFGELIDRFPTKKLPKTGGGLATVLVTIDLAVLEGRLGVATLSTGGQVTAGAARLLACRHGLIPQVLDSDSVILDQGRRIRFHTESQRVAMAARDKTCTAEGCTIPASWCHAHHRVPWSAGGRTSVKDGRMVCARHHTMLHRPDYAAEYLPNGKIRLNRTRTVRRQ